MIRKEISQWNMKSNPEIKALERKLFNLKKDRATLGALKMEMENLKNTYNFYKSPNYSDDRVQTSKKFTDEIIKKIEKQESLQRRIDDLELSIKKIDNALEVIRRHPDYWIFKEFYFHRIELKNMAKRTGKTEMTLKTKKKVLFIIFKEAMNE